MRTAVFPACLRVCVGLLALCSATAHADEIGDALAASQQALKAARESQARIARLDDETRKLQAELRSVQWKSQQLSAYVQELEREARDEEARRAELEAQLARIAATGKDLLPLLQRMVAELERWVDTDLPFQLDTRRRRVEELKALLEDPERGVAQKYRRVLEAYRSEVDYGYSVGAEEAELECGGPRGPAWVVHVGRVGLYCLSADRERAAHWDPVSRRWRPLDDDDAVEEVAQALAVARGESPPELLVLPVRVVR